MSFFRQIITLDGKNRKLTVIKHRIKLQWQGLSHQTITAENKTVIFEEPAEMFSRLHSEGGTTVIQRACFLKGTMEIQVVQGHQTAAGDMEMLQGHASWLWVCVLMC